MNIDRMPCYAKKACGSIDGSIKPEIPLQQLPSQAYMPVTKSIGKADLPEPVKIALIPLLIFLFVLYLIFKD